MRIEFDPAKDAINRAAHHISLAEYGRMDHTTSLATSVIRHGEHRTVYYGFIGHRLHIAVVTYRGLAVRPISLRKANRREERHYAAAQSR